MKMDLAGDLNLALNQLSIARNEIKNLRQQIVSLKHYHKKDVDEIKHVLQSWTCINCKDKDQASTSNHNISNITRPDAISDDHPYRFIGFIETTFANKRGVPRQPGILSQSQGIVRLDNTVLTNPQHALEGLEQFSHMWVLFYFHANESNHVRAKVAPPRLNGIRTGVFATRSPHRPSPIGLSLVKIDGIEDDCVFFSGVDMIDGTPVLDIKPYIPQYDTPYPTNVNNFSQSIHNAHSLSGDIPLTNSRNLQWERLPRESDGRSEDGDSILQDQSDTDFDFQDRLLVGEASQSSASHLDETSETHLPRADFPPVRVLDGRDCDEVFLNDSQVMLINSIEQSYFDRSPMRSASQREAPEGSEGSSPPSPAQISGNVRVADWISNPPVSRLRIQFTENCSRKIDSIMGNAESAGRVRSSIIAVLSEDPRSVYIRSRYSEEHFNCIIERLNVTCFFDDTEHTCLVTNVEELPNTSTSENILM